jgi:hypothetical protein
MMLGVHSISLKHAVLLKHLLGTKFLLISAEASELQAYFHCVKFSVEFGRVVFLFTAAKA